MKPSMFFLLMLWAFVAHAQVEVRARFSTSNPTPLIGEPVELVLVVDAPAGTVVTMPTFAVGQWGAFDVQAIGEATQNIWRFNVAIFAIAC